jgi:hypothetical protein
MEQLYKRICLVPLNGGTVLIAIISVYLLMSVYSIGQIRAWVVGVEKVCVMETQKWF